MSDSFRLSDKQKDGMNTGRITYNAFKTNKRNTGSYMTHTDRQSSHYLIRKELNNKHTSMLIANVISENEGTIIKKILIYFSKQFQAETNITPYINLCQLSILQSSLISVRLSPRLKNSFIKSSGCSFRGT